MKEIIKKWYEIISDSEKWVNLINTIVNLVKKWEISPVIAYKKFRDFEKILKNAFKEIEDLTINQIEQSPLEHKDFRISVRKTIDIKKHPLFLEKNEKLEKTKEFQELKQIEEKIKIATELSQKWWVYVDEETWEIIEPAEVKMKKYLTYTPKKSKES